MAGNKAVVEAAYEAFGRGDIEAVLGMLDASVEWSAPLTLPQGGEFRGVDGALAFFQGLGAAWDPLGLEIEGVGEVGPDLVVGVVRGTGSLRDGAAASYGAAHVFTIAGGKITRFREFTDLGGPLGG